MATHPRGDRRARCGRSTREIGARFGLVAFALSCAGALARSQASERPAFDAAKVELSAELVSKLDFEALSAGAVLTLQDRFDARGDHALALAVLEGGARARESDHPRLDAELAMLFQRIAEERRLLRRYESALDAVTDSERHLRVVLADAPEDGPLHAWALTLHCTLIGQRGWIEQDCGSLEAAAQAFDEECACLDRAPDSGAARSIAQFNADTHVANLAMLVGSPDRIETVLARRADVYEAETSHRQRASLRLKLGGAWRERARREGIQQAKAREALELAVADAALSLPERISGRLWLADLECDSGRESLAREHWKRAGEDLERMPTHELRQRRRWIGVGARLASRAGASAEDPAHWRDELAREIEAFLDEWRALSEREGGWGLLHFDDSLKLFCEFTELCCALDGEERGAARALEPLLAAHAENSVARRLGAEATTLDAVRGALCSAPNAGVLVYLAGPTRSWVFVLDRDTLRAVPLSDEFAVERPRRELVRELLANHGAWSDAARDAARTLTHELLPEAVRARVASWTSLTVSGLDLFLGDVPFELLDLGSGRPLGIEKAVWNLPSLAVGVEFARRGSSADARAPSGTPSVRLIAAPTLTPQLAKTFELTEFALDDPAVEALLAAFPEDAREVFRGDYAHVGAVGPSDALALDIEQFLVHGAFDSSRVRGSGLALASRGAPDDGFLSAAEIDEAFANGGAPALVVLTACRAGRGALRRGDAGATDLAGAFLASGSPAVVASAFDLELRLACRLSSEFYARLARGESGAEALRGAREALSLDPEFAASAEPLLVRALGFAPAPFVAWADTREGGASRVTRAAPWILGSLLAVVAGIWWLRRRAS